jgi:hypothetical protein
MNHWLPACLPACQDFIQAGRLIGWQAEDFDQADKKKK